MDKISGIYKITCLPNNKIYIGQSIDIYARWNSHRWDLNSGKHINKKLQKSWDKYGKGNFKFEILVKCEPEMLNRTESRLIQKYHALDPKVGYNIGKLLIYDLSDEEIDTLKKSMLKKINRCDYGFYSLEGISKASGYKIHDLIIAFACITFDDLQGYNFDIKCYKDSNLVHKINIGITDDIKDKNMEEFSL